MLIEVYNEKYFIDLARTYRYWFRLAPVLSLIKILFFLSINESYSSELPRTPIVGYVSSSVSSGNYDGDSWKQHAFDGAIVLPVSKNINFQIDGRFRDYSIGDGVAFAITAGQQNAIGTTIFWRDIDYGSFGFFYDSGIVEGWQSNFKSGGFHTEIFLNDKVTIGSRYTRTDNNTDKLNTGVTSTDNTYDLWISYFVQKNLSMNINYTHHSTDHIGVTDSNENIYTFSTEYYLKDLTKIDSIIALYLTHSDFTDEERHPNNAVKIELKWLLTDQKELIGVKRNGPIENRYNNYLDKPLWWNFPL